MRRGFKESWEIEKREKLSQSSFEKRGKKEKTRAWWKKTESEGGELCFSLFNWACGECLGDITARYPISPFGIAVIRWAEADISRTTEAGAHSGLTLHVLPHLHELFPFSFSPRLFAICRRICNSSAMFLISLTWRQAPCGYLNITFISPSAHFTLPVSLFLSAPFQWLYWHISSTYHLLQLLKEKHFHVFKQKKKKKSVQ